MLTIAYTVAQSSRIPTMYGPENAVDNNDSTCASTDSGEGNYWRIQFNQTLTVESVALRLKGGECYEYK